MAVKVLQVENVRNIARAELILGPGINIFEGPNGSGKTSLLEAVHVLGTGKSFRTSNLARVIKEGESCCTVFGVVENEGRTQNIGIQRSRESYSIRINGLEEKRIAALASALPVMAVTQSSSRLLDEGPQWRRKFMDWGLFHVEQSFFPVWAECSRLVRQRNALLENGRNQNELKAWDSALVPRVEQITESRRKLLVELEPIVREYAAELLHGWFDSLELFLKPGWPEQMSYADALAAHRTKDLAIGHTEYGAHRADMVVRINGKDVKDRLSRGQQKLLVFAFLLAQVKHLSDNAHKDTVLLLDDAGAELDSDHAGHLLGLLADRATQLLITTATLESFPTKIPATASLFHVEHGAINPH